MKSRPLALVFALIITAGAWLWSTLPINQLDSEVISLTSAPSQLITINEGDQLTQSYRTREPFISQISIYAANDQLSYRSLRLTITDPLGQLLATALPPTTAYRADHLELTFPLRWTNWLSTASYPYLILQLDHLRGTPLDIVTLKENSHRGGYLSVNGQPASDLDLALTTSRPIFITPGQQRGLMVGLATLLGTLVISYLRSIRLKWVAAGLLLVTITPFALGGYTENLERLGINDWDLYFSIHHSLRQSLVEYKVFPFWNPYTCGGTAGLGDPEFPLFTPTFMLELFFGVPLGLRLAIFVSTAVGALGTLALSKQLGLSPLAGLLAALIAYFGSVNLLEITEGHPNIFSAMYIPWIFWAWHHAYKRKCYKLQTTNYKLGFRIWPLLTGVFLALTFYQNGIYLLFYTTLSFLIIILLAKDRRAAFNLTFKAGLWALGLAALKLIPALFWLKQFPDTNYASSPSTLPFLYQIFLGRHLHGAEILPNQGAGWHEYGAYIGPLAIALAILSFANWRRSRLVRILAGAALLAIIISSAGPILEPIFDHLSFIPRSSISRVILFAVFPLALLAGAGLDQLPRWRASAISLQPAIIGTNAIILLTLAYPLSQQAFIVSPPDNDTTPAPVPIAFTNNIHPQRINGVDYPRAYAATLAGYGTLNYCTPLGPSPKVVTIEQSEDASIISLNRSASGTTSLSSWSPNQITAQANLSQASEVIINTNYAKGWTVNEQPVKDIAGRVGTVLPPGQHKLVFKYRSPGFFIGLAITFITVAFAAWRIRGNLKRDDKKISSL